MFACMVVPIGSFFFFFFFFLLFPVVLVSVYLPPRRVPFIQCYRLC